LKTAEQEKMEGNPGRRPINENTPMADGKIQGPPKYLSKVGARFYNDLCRVCGPENMRVLSSSDASALALVADAYAEYRLARDVVNELDIRYYTSKEEIKVTFDKKTGAEKITSSKTIKRHPAVGDMQNAWSRVMSGLSKFGMTPYDRKNVVSAPESKPVSKKDEIKEARKNRLAKMQELKKKAEAGDHIKVASND